MGVIGAVGLLGVAYFAFLRSRVIDPFPNEFVGVGIELSVRDGAPRVVKMLEGGSAGERGINEGDHLVAIDGQPTSGLTLAQLVDRIRGPAGSSVRLDLKRVDGAPLTVAVPRRALRKQGESYSAVVGP